MGRSFENVKFNKIPKNVHLRSSLFHSSWVFRCCLECLSPLCCRRRTPVRTVLRKVMEPEFLVSCYQNTPVYFSFTAFLHPPPFLSLGLLGQVRDQMDLMCSPCTAKPRALRQWLLLCALSLSSRRTPPSVSQLQQGCYQNNKLLTYVGCSSFVLRHNLSIFSQLVTYRLRGNPRKSPIGRCHGCRGKEGKGWAKWVPHLVHGFRDVKLLPTCVILTNS